MKRFRSELLGLSALFASLAAPGYAQQNFPSPSPEAAALMRSINIPVSHYTGMANINVPLYTIQTRDFQIPIQLNYQASGIKVQDCATWVGLGWRLTAGGAVTRVIRGNKADEDGYAVSDGRTAMNANWTSYELSSLAGLDTEPDYYYFEYPGNSGRFTFNSEGKGFAIPYQNIDIRLITELGGKSYYVITDGKGNKYVYERTEMSGLTGGSVGTWYLTKLKSSQGEEVVFTYETGTPYSYYTEYSHNKVLEATRDGSGKIRTSVLKENHTNVVASLSNPQYLKSISWNTGKVEFISDQSRPEGNFGRKLTEVKVYSNAYGYVKSFYLTYSQFSNNSLQLWKVEEGNASTQERQLACYFSYNTTQNLPPRNTADLDHWGYYNGPGSSANSLYPAYSVMAQEFSGADRMPHWPYTSANILTSITYRNGGKKVFEYEPNEYACRLIQIRPENKTWGGVRIKSIKVYDSPDAAPAVTRYEYKANDGYSSGTTYSDTMAYTSINTNHPLRGMPFLFRLTSRSMNTICDADGASVGYMKVREILPNGAYNLYFYTSFADRNDKPAQWGAPGEAGLNALPEDQRDGAFSFRSSSAYQRGLLLEQQSYAADGTRLFRQMYHYRQNEAIRDVITGYALDSSEYGIYEGGNDKALATYELVSQPVLLDSMMVEKGPYNLQTLTLYEYDSATLVLHKEISTGPDGVKYLTQYVYPQDFATVSGTSDMAKALTLMRANRVWEFPVETLYYRGDYLTGGEVATFKPGPDLAADNTQSTIHSVLRSDTRTLRLTDPLAAGSFTKANCNNNFTCDPRYETGTVFQNYDNRNNLLYSHDGRGTKAACLFGYSQTLPIAVVQNAVATVPVGSSVLYGDIFHTSFEDGGDSRIKTLATAKTGKKAFYGVYQLNFSGSRRVTYWESSDGVTWNKVETVLSGPANIGAATRYIDEVRICPEDARMVTYTHSPGVGITSQTDPNGNTTYYEYDALGRLSAVRDNERRLLKSYQYQ